MRNNSVSLMSFNSIDDHPLAAVWCPPSSAWSFAEFEAARAAVEQFAAVEANWDGFGALQISEDTKRNALTALSRFESIAPAPAVIPNPNGTLSFEWETEEGIGHLEIGRTRYSFYIRPSIGDAFLMDGNARQVFGLGSIINGRLYPKRSEAAYSHISTLANV